MTAPTLLDEQYDAYLTYLKVERGLAANTLEAYGRDLSDFIKAMTDAGRTDARSSYAEDVSGWARRLARAGLAQSSQKRMLVAVRGLFRFLVTRHDWPENPCDDVALPKLPKPLPHVIDFEQVARLLAEASLRDRALLALWYGAGLRVSEAVGLEVGALHLEAGLIRVIGKGNKERLVPIGGAAAEILQAYLTEERPRRLKGGDQ